MEKRSDDPVTNDTLQLLSSQYLPRQQHQVSLVGVGTNHDGLLIIDGVIASLTNNAKDHFSNRFCIRRNGISR